MLETVLAVLVITFLFLGMFELSRLLMGKMLLEHAAMRVARGRAVGFNDFMCQKIARVAVIPSAGKCLWPSDDMSWDAERGRVSIYMQAKTAGIAGGVLEYEQWPSLSVNPGDGSNVKVSMPVSGVNLDGEAGVEDNCRLYLNGL